jgi:hypothetical protein
MFIDGFYVCSAFGAVVQALVGVSTLRKLELKTPGFKRMTVQV